MSFFSSHSNLEVTRADLFVVVGDEEMKGRQVNVRNRDDTSTQDRGKPVSLQEAIEKLSKLRDDKGTYNPFPSSKPAQEKKA